MALSLIYALIMDYDVGVYQVIFEDPRSQASSSDKF